MAGSGAKRPSRRAKDQEILRLAVEDASRFLFEADGAPASAPLAGARAQSAAPEAMPAAKASVEKPHYLGHRTRLRERFTRAGSEALEDYELLELALFRIAPRQDTKPLAKALLTRFGDLAGVLGADEDALKSVPGAGSSVALELKITHALLARAQRSEVKRRAVLSSWSALISYCRLTMAQASRESFRVLFLDVKNNLIADEVLGEGTIDHAPVYPREVARRALQLGAAAAILVHNHPSGDPRPSAADIAITRDVMAAAKAVGVLIHDHVIVGRDGVSSLKNMQLM
jgi:DNA repair protein RadC